MAPVQSAPLDEMLSFGSRQRSRRSSGLLIGGAVVGIGILALVLWPTEQITQRPNDMKTTQVVLPPPPPPPPPPEPEVVEQPPEPTVAPPIEQPVDTPPPPDQSNPTPGDNALTAREGAGPSNYGLASGDGSGTRIGGRPGGDAFLAYASVAQACISRATQGDRELTRGRYRAELAVSMASDGRIANARVSGVEDRLAARISELLNAVQCQPPPAGLPLMRIELSTRSGA